METFFYRFYPQTCTAFYHFPPIKHSHHFLYHFSPYIMYAYTVFFIVAPPLIMNTIFFFIISSYIMHLLLLFPHPVAETMSSKLFYTLNLSFPIYQLLDKKTNTKKQTQKNKWKILSQPSTVEEILVFCYSVLYYNVLYIECTHGLDIDFLEYIYFGIVLSILILQRIFFLCPWYKYLV